MFTKTANQEVDFFIVIHWLLMSLCAGILNAIAFVGLGTFATHVTGFATLFGVNSAELRFKGALAAITVPLFFLLGAVVSGLCVEARVRRNKVPHYDYVMYGCSALMFLACLIGDFRYSDQIQTYLHLEKNFVLLSLICLTSGLINAALSYSSSSTVRITHMTGLTTDLGRGIAEFISLRVHGMPIAAADRRVNRLRAFSIGSFIVGSLVGGISFHLVKFNALLVPAVYFAYAGEHGRKIRQSFERVEKARGL